MTGDAAIVDQSAAADPARKWKMSNLESCVVALAQIWKFVTDSLRSYNISSPAHIRSVFFLARGYC